MVIHKLDKQTFAANGKVLAFPGRRADLRYILR
ncbi:hypothetical protein POI8812_01291 [Pontivivens insulae]|uniref:Uncharacterized protein n=1 Tax=Pontivivens insulae TaxID=1639689 RepID=A0A2R8A9T0_9RHOB|nr:hypothetical protein DFR53_2027 [Pontivivens insulae]SPF28986.1 hypothetical protein POI8812_01291 [Pontivivens insulae]